MKTLKKKYLIPLTSCLAVGLISPVFAHPFTDVDQHWAKNQITWAYEKEIVAGVNYDHFAPDNTISKGEFYRMINQYFGLTSKAPVHYADVTSSMWFYDDVAKGIYFGYLPDSQGNLKAMSAITRDEACRILAKMYHLKSLPEKATDFADRHLIVNLGEVGALVDQNIIVGKPDNHFDPEGFLSRAEFTVILKAANDRLGSPSRYERKTETTKGTFGYAQDATPYNIFKDKMLTKGYSLDQVKDLWDRGYRDADHLDKRYWKNYNDFYRYYKGLNYTDTEINRMWRDHPYYYDDTSYWYRRWTNYDDFYNYFHNRGYSNKEINYLWNHPEKAPSWIYPGRNFSSYGDFYSYFKRLGYSESDINYLWNKGYGRSYHFANYQEFYNYFKNDYPESKIIDMWNDGDYTLIPYLNHGEVYWRVLD